MNGITFKSLMARVALSAVAAVSLGVGSASAAEPIKMAITDWADVLATDWYDEALRFTAWNAATAGARVATALVDWADPPPALLGGPPADLVVGADVLYEERNGPALAALVPRILAPDGELVVADPRRPHADGLLDPLAAAGWSRSTAEVRDADPACGR